MSDGPAPVDLPATDAVPAATVVLLRDGAEGVETLMLRRDTNLEFAGGAWVFPGGRVDPDDYADGIDPARADDTETLAAARNAAVRETAEEAGLAIDVSELVFFAHWTPATSAARRFATWFFVVRAPEGAVTIDDGEIRAHEWVTPADVVARHRAGEVSLLPPTWMTLLDLQAAPTVDELLEQLGAREPAIYVSKIAQTSSGVTVAMWDGDAGYDDGDPERPGPRHRLWLHRDGWEFEQR
ncbi:MAG TPA: NUDIX hydrolase [Acidimicrobiia bacterium]|nr:NUDIX hydrolase [Acidimicrobiia bacterium]